MHMDNLLDVSHCLNPLIYLMNYIVSLPAANSVDLIGWKIAIRRTRSSVSKGMCHVHLGPCL